ncbi:MBL fold metallo-hydrolase [Candidatus Dojkabacteria bacterium]|jgi:competence protein ComEC|nr:MBL fold metallo-hydrolase [Candidatus Dojkabacteria bacterium]
MPKALSILISVIFILFEVFSHPRDPQIVFLDVGQGDSMLFTYGNFQMLVDGGPGDYLINSLGKYQSLFDRDIEVVVLTHPHGDHFYGLIDIFKRYSVGALVVPDCSCIKDESYRQLISLLPKETKIVSSLRINMENISISVENYGTKCEKGMNLNDLSLVTKIRIGDSYVLGMGDLEEDMEENVKDISNIEVLKAGHHCSKTSTNEAFLKRINPIYVICSVGRDNKFGHPAEEKIEMFKGLKIKYFITYDTGDLVFRYENKRLTLIER